MREKIIIRLPSRPDKPVHWAHQPADDNTAVNEGQGALDEIVTIATGAHITMLAPGIETTLTQAKMPAIKSSRIQQIVGFALEESLSEEVSRVHFAVGRRREDGTVPTAVISRRFMDEWRGKIRDAGLRPHEIVSEVLYLPWAEDEWSVLLEQESVNVRTGLSSGFATDLSQLSTMLDLAYQQTPEALRPKILRVYSFVSPEQEEQALSDLPSEVEVQVEPTQTYESPLHLMLSLPESQGTEMNFLSGEYSLHREFRKLWLPWRGVAVLAGILIAVQLIYSIIQLRQFEQQDAQVREQQHEIFRATLPEIKTIRFPRRQMEAQLKERSANQIVQAQDFIEFFAPIASHIQAAGVELQSVNFRAGTLDLGLVTPDLSSLESLQARFEKLEKLEVELRSVVTGNNQAEGTIRLRRRV